MSQKYFWILSSLLWAWAYTLGFNEMGGAANVYAAYGCTAMGVVLAVLGRGALNFGPISVWLGLLLLIPLNVAVAYEQSETLLRWGYFLLLFKVACAFCENTHRDFMRGYTAWLPLGLMVVMVADLYARGSGGLYDYGTKAAGHAITLYATLLAAIAPFRAHFWQTLGLWGFSIFFIYLSGSRGALLSLLPVFFVGFLYYTKTAQKARASAIFILLFLTAILGPAIFELFSQMKVANPSKITAWESAENSLTARIQLARNAWDLVMQNPLTGWGVGQTYNRVEGLYESAAVHSVWIITLLQFGVPLGVGINLYVLIMPLRTMLSRITDPELAWLTTSVFTGYFFRATFEPITFFDLGSMWSFAHLVLFAYAAFRLSNPVPSSRPFLR